MMVTPLCTVGLFNWLLFDRNQHQVESMYSLGWYPLA
jgi:hypothetical protein